VSGNGCGTRFIAPAGETAIEHSSAIVLQFLTRRALVQGIPVSTVGAEAGMEARIARLESDVAHIRTDIAEVKTDLRRLDTNVDNLNHTLSGKIDSLKDDVASAKIWALVLYIALAAGMFGTMARGFGWL